MAVERKSAPKKINFEFPSIPRGDDGIAKSLEMLTNATLEVYPSLESSMGRLITKPEQIHWVTGAVRFVGQILETNFNLLPVPKEVPNDSRNQVSRMVRQLGLDALLQKLVLDVGDSIAGDDFDVIENVMHSLIYCAEPKYRPRFVFVGGMTLCIWPHQTSNTYECEVGLDFHKDAYYYLGEPILQTFADTVKRIGYTKGVPIAMQDLHVRSVRGKNKLQSLDFEDTQEILNQYQESRLASSFLASQGFGLGV